MQRRRQRIALIANPAAGSGEGGELAERLAEAGADVETYRIGDAGEAARSRPERIVVAGGDGSLAPAAVAAAEAGVPLAVVPAGTANDFAERMGLPADTAEAARLAVAGERTRAVDIARVGDRPFLNVASLGLPPAAAEAAEPLKDSIGALAYTVGALRAGTAAEPFDCRVSCDSEPLWDGAAWQLTVGCTGAFGAGSRIDADADDGRLDVVVIEGGPRARLAKHAIGMKAGRIERQRGVRSGRGARIEAELDAARGLNVDGELVDGDEVGGERLHFTVEPGALTLVVG